MVARTGLPPPPPLHVLQAFEAAARNASLAKAAGELRVTTQAVAQSISLLEDRVGLQLVRQVLPTVELTRVGERYFAAVQGFAHGLQDGLYERLPAGRTQLCVSTSQALSRLWLAPRLASFAEKFPRIDLIITTTDQYQSVAGGGVDIGLRYGGPALEGQISLPLWTDRLVAVGTPSRVREVVDLSPVELVRTQPLVEHPAASWRQWIAALDPEAAASVRPRLTCADLHLAIESGCLGMGFVLAPARVLGSRLLDGRLARASQHSIPAKPYHAVVSAEQAGRTPIQALLGWLMDEVARDADSFHAPDPTLPRA